MAEEKKPTARRPRITKDERTLRASFSEHGFDTDLSDLGKRYERFPHFMILGTKVRSKKDLPSCTALELQAFFEKRMARTQASRLIALASVHRWFMRTNNMTTLAVAVYDAGTGEPLTLITRDYLPGSDNPGIPEALELLSVVPAADTIPTTLLMAGDASDPELAPVLLDFPCPDTAVVPERIRYFLKQHPKKENDDYYEYLQEDEFDSWYDAHPLLPASYPPADAPVRPQKIDGLGMWTRSYPLYEDMPDLLLHLTFSPQRYMAAAHFAEGSTIEDVYSLKTACRKHQPMSLLRSDYPNFKLETEVRKLKKSSTETVCLKSFALDDEVLQTYLRSSGFSAYMSLGDAFTPEELQASAILLDSQQQCLDLLIGICRDTLEPDVDFTSTRDLIMYMGLVHKMDRARADQSDKLRSVSTIINEDLPFS